MALFTYLIVGMTLTLTACGSEGLKDREQRRDTDSAGSTIPPGSTANPSEDTYDPNSGIIPAIDGRGRADDTIDFNQPNIGLYWMGPSGKMQKALPDKGSSYYDPRRPTLIYVHGWQQGSVAMNYHESSLRDVVGESIDLAESWHTKAWNVGFFLWTEFADDQLLLAEQKIWDPKAMTWIDPQGTRRNLGGTKAASDFLYEAYMMAMKYQQTSEIRLAGHSLGSQMVSNLAQRLTADFTAKKIGPQLLPDRVILLDPFFSVAAKAYLNNEANGDRVTRFARQYTGEGAMSLEIYRTSSLSLLPLADAHPALIGLSAFRNIYSDNIFQVTDQGPKHNYAVAYYLWSFAGQNPSCSPGNVSLPPDFPSRAVSAASSKADILKYMKSDIQLRSTDQGTATPVDDACFLERKGTI